MPSRSNIGSIALGASEWADKKVDALSKGMAQKIQFIAAVVNRPQLLVLDEPFSGLDPVNMEALRDAVLHMRDQGTTVVFSTHDMEMAGRLCDTIFMIFKGRKVLDGTLDEIQASYPAERARIRFADPSVEMPDFAGIDNIAREGPFIEFRMEDPSRSNELLRSVADRHEVSFFEIRRPSLHEIFVQIAGPEAQQITEDVEPTLA